MAYYYSQPLSTLRFSNIGLSCTRMCDRSSMSISADSPLDETLNQLGPLALLLRRQYEFPFVQFSFFSFSYRWRWRLKQQQSLLFFFSDEDSTLSIGVAGKDLPMNKHPGKHRPSVGWHSRMAKIIRNDRSDGNLAGYRCVRGEYSLFLCLYQSLSFYHSLVPWS